MDILYIVIGLVILLFAGDALVRGAVSLSLKLGIPAFIVSLTVVAFGTSAPELLIAVQAAIDWFPGLALGNVVGSNIANVLLVLGVPAIMAPMMTSQTDTKVNYLYMMAASLIFCVLAMLGPMGPLHGVILLSVLAFVLMQAIRSARTSRAAMLASTEDLGEVDESGLKILFFLAIGLVGLPLGAHLLVEGSVSIAQKYGVDETIIGLTIVAVGTSLPELATTVMAALRKQAEVALGNVIGSNMFNLLAVMGVTTLVAPVPVAPSFLMQDLPVMILASAALAPFALWKMDLTRLWGFIFVTVYAIFIGVLINSIL